MSIKVVEPEVSFQTEGTRVGPRAGEHVITRPASEMNIVPGDLPTRWAEVPVKLSEQLRLEKGDYAVSRFTLMDGHKDRGQLSFETVVYPNRKAAVDVLVKTLSKMTCLKLTRVDLGEAGAMMEAVGKAGRRMKAIAFVERNVYGLIMLSCDEECSISDSWLIGMGRTMVSRMH
jgi:hypothetical protein